jgi:hypothetical protein
VPKRIRLSRGKGWRKPEGAVVVARPSKWGNPFKIGAELDRAASVQLYREYLAEHPELAEAARRELAGRDLACWCPLDEPCHGDVLLEVANSPTR